MSDIAVIIVNYGAAGLAADAVDSALAQGAGGRAVEVHLVDNASPGDDAARLREAAAARGWGDRVALWLETENHGFGRGNNLVLRQLAGRRDPPKYAFLLNPDARLKDDALAVLADFLDRRPDVAIAGCRIEKPDGGPVSSAFRFPGLASEFSLGLSFGPVFRLLSNLQTALPPDHPTGPVDWVSGAAMMGRLDALATVGFFDPGYFLYFEEVDLMRRLARGGWPTWLVAEAEAIHVEGAATGVRSGEPVRRRRPAYWYESWGRYFGGNHGRAYALACALAQIGGVAGHHAIRWVLRREPSAPVGFFGDFRRHALAPLLCGGRPRPAGG